MNSDNLVILHGYVGKDPELKITPAGKPLCKFSIATKETWKTAEGVVKEKTQWHNIAAWDKLAELAEKFIKKGQELIVTGKLEYSETPDKDNPSKKVYYTNIVAGDFRFCGKKNETSAPKTVDPEPPLREFEPSSTSNYGDDIPF